MGIMAIGTDYSAFAYGMMTGLQALCTLAFVTGKTNIRLGGAGQDRVLDHMGCMTISTGQIGALMQGSGPFMAQATFMTAKADAIADISRAGVRPAKNNIGFGAHISFRHLALVGQTFAMTISTAILPEPGSGIRCHPMSRVQNIGCLGIFMTPQTGFNPRAGRIGIARRRRIRERRSAGQGCRCQQQDQSQEKGAKP